MSFWNNPNPFGSIPDQADMIVKLSQLQNTTEVAAIRALLEREINKGSERAKARTRELAALLQKHVCPVCVLGKGGQRTTASCNMCSGKDGILFESEIPFKDRRNLEPLKMPCKSCDGRGSRDGRTACSNCGGTGEEVAYGQRIYGSRSRKEMRKESRLPAMEGKEPMYNCPRCNGTGTVPLDCVACKGTGIINRAEYERELKRIEERYR